MIFYILITIIAFSFKDQEAEKNKRDFLYFTNERDFGKVFLKKR